MVVIRVSLVAYMVKNLPQRRERILLSVLFA